MKRLFVAIDLSDEEPLKKLLGEIKIKLSKEKIGWVKPENLHITINFLGSTVVEKIDSISEIISRLTASETPMMLQPQKVGLFGSRYAPRVIWVGFDACSQLEMLALNLKNELVALGYPFDRQNFVPHLTLGRISSIAGKAYFQHIINQYETLNFDKIKIEKIYLYESILQKSGPEYKVLKTFELIKT